ncbi:MAG: hypothetical protein IIB19_06065 [Chloroflexi bacterium]|nr:hypothetical protein [Chloroflexota bacterium]
MRALPSLGIREALDEQYECNRSSCEYRPRTNEDVVLRIASDAAVHESPQKRAADRNE